MRQLGRHLNRHSAQTQLGHLGLRLERRQNTGLQAPKCFLSLLENLRRLNIAHDDQRRVIGGIPKSIPFLKVLKCQSGDIVRPTYDRILVWAIAISDRIKMLLHLGSRLIVGSEPALLKDHLMLL